MDFKNAFLHRHLKEWLVKKICLFSCYLWVLSQLDHSLFIYKNGSNNAYILLYMDDIILIVSSDYLHKQITNFLATEFSKKDLSPLSFFLDIIVTRHNHCLFLSQK